VKCKFAAKEANMNDCKIQRTKKAKSDEKFSKRS
jgi:hypothetical protein